MNHENKISHWWNNLDEKWKKIIQINFTIQFEMTAKESAGLKKQGVNPFDNYMYRFGETFELYKTGKSFFEKVFLLEHLYAAYCEVNEILAIEPLEHLRIVDFSFNDITNIEILKIHRDLQELYLEKNSLSSIQSISHLPKLEILNLRYNQLDSIEALSSSLGLTSLDIGINKLRSIDSLQHHKQLKILICDANLIENIPIISNLENLERLDIKNNRLRTFPFENIGPKLRYIDISRNELSISKAEMEQIAKKKNIEIIY